MLGPDSLRHWRDLGFVVLPGFKPAAELAALRERALAIADAFDPAAGSGIFSTVDSHHSAEDWFLGSGDRVRCFFEDEAFDATGRLRRPKRESINKIGHAMHDLDPVFDAFSHGPALAALARDLGLADARIVQSMFIFKPPAIGGEVRWHQDATYLIAEPDTVTGFWFALEDATVDNGCLWVQPGGHRGALRERFVREGDAVRTERLESTPWPTLDEALPVEVAAGTLVCFHGRLPHYSGPNRSAQSRHAYTLHAIDASSAWSPLNWLRRGAALPWRGFD
jgi:phytanoyl-CoA hydroxylase